MLVNSAMPFSAAAPAALPRLQQTGAWLSLCAVRPPGSAYGVQGKRITVCAIFCVQHSTADSATRPLLLCAGWWQDAVVVAPTFKVALS